MELLRGAIRTYAWGSRTAIPEFTGRPAPAAHPEAELWFGAHPGDPAMLDTPAGGVSLLQAIAADPEGQLGPVVRAEFGDVLPFLVKVLAADEPLSLQAHPSAQQAADGFRHEDQRGVPINSPVRNYRDPNHKPELLMALTDFHALAGFRPAARSVALMRALAVPALEPYIALLAETSDADGLRAVFTTWITLPQPDLDVLIPAVLEAAVAYIRSGGGEFTAEARTVLELGERYPGDAGVLAAMLLNRVSLSPGQAIFLPAGNLHAYLNGVGMEVMANSDNVLRGGLTQKHIDVEQLLTVVDFRATDVPVMATTDLGQGVRRYEAGAKEFAVWSMATTSTPAAAPGRGARIVLVVAGNAVAGTASDEIPLRRGEAILVGDDEVVTLAGDGLAYVAGPGCTRD